MSNNLPTVADTFNFIYDSIDTEIDFNVTWRTGLYSYDGLPNTVRLENGSLAASLDWSTDWKIVLVGTEIGVVAFVGIQKKGQNDLTITPYVETSLVFECGLLPTKEYTTETLFSIFGLEVDDNGSLRFNGAPDLVRRAEKMVVLVRGWAKK